MSEYSVSFNESLAIDFDPADEKTEILQNIKMILATIKGTCPLNRAFGWNSDFLDKPIQLVQSLLTSEINTVLKKYESRASLKSITPTLNDDDGATNWTVVIAINE